MPQQPDLNWIILAWDADEVKIYQLRMDEYHNTKEEALTRFRHLCKEYEWKPFQKINIYHPTGGELCNITTLAVLHQ